MKCRFRITSINAIVAILLLPTSMLASYFPAAATEVGFKLEVPVDCKIGKNCSVQNYVDHARGPAQQDYTCGHLTYDGHDGTDFRVPTVLEMRRGVSVVAAAPGRVKALRDGMSDVFISKIDQSILEGREAGNGVVVDHGEGWETQYSHLMKDSIAVEIGDTVAAGQMLGMIGLSGLTEFPHVEFSVRHNGKEVDPFTGMSAGSGCGLTAQSLWSEDALRHLSYQSGGLLAAGFSLGKPNILSALEGEYSFTSLPSAAPALVFWVASWGLRAGDEEVLTVWNPDGSELLQTKSRIPGHKAQWLKFSGKKRPRNGWARGQYRANYQVVRNEVGGSVEIVSVTKEIEIR